jgi:predicted aconitase
MKLTGEEQAMLDGAMGPGTQKAMQILVTLGDIYGAEKMVSLDHVHVASGTVISTGFGGVKLVEWFAENGAVTRCTATVNPSSLDPVRWKELGIPQEFYDWQIRLTAAYEKMNVIATHCCTPYLLGLVPRIGEYMSSGESSAIAMYNGFFGARTNRQGCPSSLASAITARAPLYGLLLDENRHGEVLIHVEAQCETPHDFSSLGYFAGKICAKRIPVFTGLDHVNIDNCKMMSAAMNTSGAVAHFHIVGKTPEAPTVEAALGGKKASEEHRFTQKDKEAVEEKLNANKESGPLDMVVFGCPHVSLDQVREIAGLIKGRRFAPSVTFEVLASEALKALCDRQGYTKAIEDAGGMILVRTCPTCYPLGEIIAEERGIRSLATDSAKMAHYITADSGRFPAYYGTTERCVEAAVNGYWQ